MPSDVFKRKGKMFRAERRKDGTFKEIKVKRKSPKPATKKKRKKKNKTPVANKNITVRKSSQKKQGLDMNIFNAKMFKRKE